MWFFFGFITLLSSCAYMGYKRFHAQWKGERKRLGKLNFLRKIKTHKQQTTAILLGVECADDFDFRFKQEHFVDRVCKSIGLCREYEVGHADFDSLVYIVSDDRSLHVLLRQNQHLIKTILGIFKEAERLQCKIRSLECRKGRLWVNLKPLSDAQYSPSDYRFGENIVAALHEIALELANAPTTQKIVWRDPFILKAAVILSISSGLAINGAIHLFRLSKTTFPFTVDDSTLFWDAFWLGAGLILIMIAATLLLLGRSARSHLVVIELLLVGFFGAVASSFAELRDLNIEMDSAATQVHTVKMLDKHTSRSRRSGTSYYLYLDDWNRELGERKVKVPRYLYDSLKIGDFVAINQKPGYLDYRWVESMRKTADLGSE